MTDPQGTSRAAGGGLEGTIVAVEDFSPVQFLESRLQGGGECGVDLMLATGYFSAGMNAIRQPSAQRAEHFVLRVIPRRLDARAVLISYDGTTATLTVGADGEEAVVIRLLPERAEPARLEQGTLL